MVIYQNWNPWTLKKTCIIFIAYNFDEICGDDFESKFGSIPKRILYVLGPFDDVPGDICEDIFDTLGKIYHLRSVHVHLLLLPQIRHIKLTARSESALVSEALTLLSYRCQRLVFLDLTNCSHVTANTISGCLEHLTSLRKLILRQTKTESIILKSIALHLSRLIYLDLRGCPVSDSDALLLCGNSGDFEPVCTQLAWLDINRTKVELIGCMAILQCFQNLRYLSFPDTVEAVAQLHKEETPEQTSTNSLNTAENNQPSTSKNTVNMADDTVPANHHKLEVLHASVLLCKFFDPESIRLACSYCPNVREVHLDRDATDEALKHLLLLRHLSVLEVSSSDCDPVTFHGGLEPLLRAQGPEMVKLQLYNVRSVDFELLGALCPQLQHLKVVSLSEKAGFSQTNLTDKQQADSFRELRHLTLEFGTHMDGWDPSNLLKRAGSLERLHLIGSSCFTDQRLQAALAAHGFAALTKLQVACNMISVEYLGQFVTSCPQLTWLSVVGCQHISYHNIGHLDDLISKERKDIILEWR